MGLQLSFGNVILSKKHFQNKIIWSFLGLSPPKWRAADVSTACPETRQKPLEHRSQERPNFPRFDSKVLQILQHGPFWAVRIGWTSPHFEWCQKPPPGNKPDAYDMRCVYLKLILTSRLAKPVRFGSNSSQYLSHTRQLSINCRCQQRCLTRDTLRWFGVNEGIESFLKLRFGNDPVLQDSAGFRLEGHKNGTWYWNRIHRETIPSTRRSMNAYAWGLKNLESHQASLRSKRPKSSSTCSPFWALVCPWLSK